VGITKRAVTVIGLRVPVDKISHEVNGYLNDCKCSPHTVGASFCPHCGMNTNRKYTRRELEHFVELTGDDAFELLPRVDGYEMVGNWHERTHVYIGYLVSSTAPAYSAEGSDPVMCAFSLNITGEDSIQKFIDSMKSVNLWESEKFGIWTILLSE